MKNLHKILIRIGDNVAGISHVRVWSDEKCLVVERGTIQAGIGFVADSGEMMKFTDEPELQLLCDVHGGWDLEELGAFCAGLDDLENLPFSDMPVEDS